MSEGGARHETPRRARLWFGLGFIALRGLGRSGCSRQFVYHLGQDVHADAASLTHWAKKLEHTRQLMIGASSTQPKDEAFSSGTVHDMLVKQFLMISDFLVQKMTHDSGTEQVRQVLRAYCRIVLLLGPRVGPFVRNIVIFLADLKPAVEVRSLPPSLPPVLPPSRT